MEISNNNLITTLSTDIPSQPSDANPRAKSAKKKVAGEEPSFDGTLGATLNAQTPVVTVPAAGNIGADKFELSAQGAAAADAAAATKGGAPAPTIASLFQAKAQESANGPIAGAFVAGPDQPWGSRWVFGAGNQPTAEDLAAAKSSGGKPAPESKGEVSIEQLKKLLAVAAQAGTPNTTTAQGGDESQLNAANEASIQDIEAAVSALGGKLESVRTQGKDALATPVKGQLNALGGAEYLSALQGGKLAATGGAKGSALKGGTEIGGIGDAKLAKAKLAETKLAGFDSSLQGAQAITQTTVAKPTLQVLPGGLSSGPSLESGHLQGGLRLSKDEPQAAGDSVFIGATPLSAIKTSDQLGAVPPQTLTGHVVPGAMQRDRLTSESVRNMANSITGMTAAGGGEMRIKMNPGNLGELMIHVSTNGKEVGLKVQADNAGSKKIIEDSLGALRDSLASQSLALGRVDVTLATTSSQSSEFGSNSQSPNQQHAGSSSFDGQTPNQGRFTENSGNEDRSSSGASRSRIAAMASSGVTSRPSASRSADASRLDVMA